MTSKCVEADEFKVFLTERGINNTKASLLLGVHRDTVQKWLHKNRVPVGTLEALRNMDLKLYRYTADFSIALDRGKLSNERFCQLAGIPAATLVKWKSDDMVPKWALTIARQHLTIHLMKAKLDPLDLDKA